MLTQMSAEDWDVVLMVFRAVLPRRGDKGRDGTRGRVEDGRGGLGHAATLRFPSPLIKPDVRISRIRLSDGLHPTAHGGAPHASGAAEARRACRTPLRSRSGGCRARAPCGAEPPSP